jgi:hypothetical protein
MAAIDELNELLSALPGYELLTPTMKQRALDSALIPDSFNVWPGQAGYESTYDTYFAALNLISFLRAQKVVRQVSSEGTSVAVDAPDWSALVAYYRSMSHIIGVTGNSILQVIPIPGGSHVRRTDMTERGDRYGNVDTDVG